MDTPTIAGKTPIKQDLEPGTYFWCSCGKSDSQPFCDGSHKGTDFKPVKLTVEESCTRYFCSCKHTKNAPLCDGSHKHV